MHITRMEKAQASSQVQIQLAFVQSNVDYAVESLLKVSDPTSPEYGQHWTAREIVKFFSPQAKDVSAAVGWLHSSGISAAQLSGSHGRGHILIDLTVGDVERLFNTTCSRFIDGQKGKSWIDCGPYNIPDSLSSSIDYVATVRRSLQQPPPRAPNKPDFRRPLAQVPQAEADSSNSTNVDCNQYTALSCLRKLYNIPLSTTPHPNNSFGIYEIAWVTWLPDDLDQFFTMFQPDLIGQRPFVEPIDGGYLQTEYQLEAFNLEPDLDFEYAMALTRPQPVKNIQVGDELLGGDLNDMLAAFDKYYCDALNSSIDPTFPDPLLGGYNQTTDCGTATPPQVLSISYSSPEVDFSPQYLQRQCLEFLKLGLMGVTVIVSSGDTGTASGVLPGTCIDADTGASNATTGKFSPQWPASCPWVTSVGGTEKSTEFNLSATLTTSTMNDPSLTNETAIYRDFGNGSILSSGGGFSNVFTVPPYQQVAISQYQDHQNVHLGTLEALGYFTSGGRGFPDVAALAYRYLAIIDGNLTAIDGTSASAPVFASIISMINNELLNAGKSVVGFINPALYSHPEALNDVVVGQNEGCGANPAFNAAEGWDPVTGLGTPDYERLRNMFLELP
ncbi:subtilisin-like protein [Mollisia scopiformis]|uniref:Subtilisin-like protein n=1 Tax=Mollisia scopiformis TaxID=149040 RepID=A0A132B5D5_MOLSC|nr:subtilisin-like protein [Mollisia scopiformis]KUJ07551.1 subtilisin-like protein [Mollisia scopiformis]